VSAKQFNLDFDKILEIALKGVRRASVFMGLGVNLALDEQAKSYQLTQITNIQLVPDEVSDETLHHFKDEFRIWIEAAGLRELSEAFASYLDALHKACLIVHTVQTKAPPAEIEEKQTTFAAEGLPNKLNILKQRFSVEPQHTSYIVSIGRARNCLGHRRGIVGAEDLRGGEELEVIWLGMDLFVETPAGERHFLNETPEEGIFLPQGGTVNMQFVERKRTFGLGTKLALSTRDLAEICWFYEREAKSAFTSALSFAEKAGVHIAKSET
jgi:hypothetical protein